MHYEGLRRRVECIGVRLDETNMLETVSDVLALLDRKPDRTEEMNGTLLYVWDVPDELEARCKKYGFSLGYTDRVI